MKRKSYIVDKFSGQNSNDSAELLPVGEMTELKNGFVNEDGSFDGDQVGTEELITGLNHEPLSIHHWKSNDGSEYILTWGDKGSSNGNVCYYNKTKDAVYTDLLQNMPVDYPPEFVNWGNEYVIMLAGRYGSYKISSSGVTLSATALTDVPAGNFGRVWGGALYQAQETSIIHSAVNDPLRWTPTREERRAGVYDTANRLILSSAGVMGETMGYEIWKGLHILWTQYDCYVAAWDGGATVYATKLQGYGLYGLRGFTTLDDRIRFYSTYKEGSVCSIVTGTAGSNGETFTVGQDIRVSVVEEPGCKKISDILRACPKPTTGKKIIAIDSKEDWENASKVYSKTGFDTTTTPGWISLQGATKQTATPQGAYLEVANPGSVKPEYIGTIAEDGPLDVDGAPVYDTELPTPTIYKVYLDIDNKVTVTAVNFVELWAKTPDGTIKVIDKNKQTAGISDSMGWTQNIPSTPVKEVTGAMVVFSLRVKGYYVGGGGAVGFEKDVLLVRRYSFYPGFNLHHVNMYQIRGANVPIGVLGAMFEFNIGEVEFWGFRESTGTITTGPSATTSLFVTGLAAGTADLGMFQIGYQGTNDDGTGGLTGASAPTTVEVGIGITTNPADWGAIDTPTANGSISYMTAAELKVGLKLSRLIGVFTFAAGGTLYVRCRVPVALQDGSYASPMIDRLIWDFSSGSARTSIFPMFTWQHKTILSLPTNSSSTECDQAIAINDNNYCTVFNNVKWLAGCSDPDETIVTAGITLAKLGEGTDNILTATNTPTKKIIKTPKIKGLNKLFARGIKFGVSKFMPSGSIVLSNTATAIIPTPAELTDTTINTATVMDTNASVVGSDGCVYFLTPFKPTGKNWATSLVLVKLDPATSVLTRINVDVTVPADNNNLKAYSLCLSQDKSFIHIFWAGLSIATAYSQIFRYNKYDIAAGTLGTVTSGGIATLTSSNLHQAFSALCDSNGYLYCASDLNAGASAAATVYKSIDGGVTFTLDKSIPYTSGNGYIQLMTNKDSNIVLAYYNYATIKVTYTIENINGIWRTAKTLRYNAVISGLRLASTSTTDYAFVKVSGTIYAYYLNNGVWTSLTTATTLGNPFTAFGTKNDTVVLIYTDDSSPTTTRQMEFSGTSYSAQASLIVSLTCTGYIIAPPLDDTAYLWVFATYWKPYAISVKKLVGTYPLEISIITKNGEQIIYTQYTPITELTYIPERDQDLRLVQGSFLQAKLTAIGQIKCIGYGIEYDEQEGSL